MKIQLFLHDAGLYDSPPFIRVHLEHAVQALRHVDDDRFPNGLSGKTRPAASRKNWYFELPCDLHRGENVLVGSRNHDSDRLDFINAGVGAVHQPRSPVEADFPVDAAFQGLVKVVVHRFLASGSPSRASRYTFGLLSYRPVPHAGGMEFSTA